MTAGSIRLISASAGSGKTHSLVSELETAITRDVNPVRPEAVVATTFTVKAAAELRERVRSRLLEAGRVEDAHRLGAARIGTVNAICSQLVADFAFDLGVSPDVRVLDEVAAETAFRRALSGVTSAGGDPEGEGPGAMAGEASPALMELFERWPKLEWLDDVRTIAQRARENGLGPAELRASAARSIEGLLAYLEPADANGEALDRRLEQALGTFERARVDDTKTTRAVLALVRAAHARLGARRSLSWWEWAKLAAANTGAKSRDLYEPVREAARGHERHPRLRDDVSVLVTHVFELAAQALEAYERYKREWGVMDFVDQEVRALELLAKPDVREMLREQVDLVLVDEFQDTSPLQLRIFLALSRIAPDSVWVGDQKQAIYGFRGTDPALMDTAIAAILEREGDEAYRTLPYSWRSRAELVRLTSDVFAPAFDANGIPAERVHLEPAPEIAARPDTMGPIVESWVLESKKVDDDALAVAGAVRLVLEDPGVRVRDVVTGDERPVERRDVAILCRSNTSCERVTRALESVGIRAVRPRAGLMRTPEARLVVAALRLWVDVRQPLAAAEIGRLLVHPDAADEWLRRVMEARGEAYASEAEIERLARVRAALPLAGPLEAFDAVVEAVGAREVCLRWERSAGRLANLDALRAFVHRYVDTCETEGQAATVAGLVAHLAGLEEEKQDKQATLGGEDAVTVSTLHGAKGLEWPITVLHEIDTDRKPTAFGVHVVCDRERFDFDDPLGGRSIRYWPDPYAPQSSTELHARVRGGPEHAEAERRQVRETLRLLYVGWTRARDRLVLTGRPGKVIGRTLGLLCDGGGEPLITEPDAECWWGGRPVTVQMRSTGPAEPVAGAPEPGLGYDAAGPREFPPASANMSQLEGTGTLGAVEVLGPESFIQGDVESIALGSAVHAFMAGDRPGIRKAERAGTAGTCPAGVAEARHPGLAVGMAGAEKPALPAQDCVELTGVEDAELAGAGCADFAEYGAVSVRVAGAERAGFEAGGFGRVERPSAAAARQGPTRNERVAMAASNLERWSVRGALRAESLVREADALYEWIAQRWPRATWHREWPVRLRDGKGTELAGYADLVLMEDEGFVLIDHKCVSGTRDQALAACTAYGGQLAAYAEAITKATGKRCSGTFIHLVAQAVVAAVAIPAGGMSVTAGGRDIATA